MELDAARAEFRRLDAEAFGTPQFREFVVHLHDTMDLTPDDQGWVLWNICDQYAMAQDAATQNKYQSQFLDLVTRNFPERAHWVVCDSTQANGQIRGGFGDFWRNAYTFANETAPHVAANRGARFEAHRANAGAYMGFGDIKQSKIALEAMAGLLQEDPQWPSLDFASAVYEDLRFALYAATGQADKMNETGERLERILDEWLLRASGTPGAKSRGEPLFGSWQWINEDRPPASVFTAIHNAACTFTEPGWFPVAERLFRIVIDAREEITACGEALFLQSCWHNRHDRDEIVRMLKASKRVSAEYLISVAPEMAEVVRD